MLGTANHLALSQAERVIIELGEIEDSARRARAMIETPPPESSALTAARMAATAADRRCGTLQTQFEEASAAAQDLQKSPPWWRLAIGLFTGATARRAKEVRSAVIKQNRVHATLTAAKTEKSNAELRLRRELQHHKDAVRAHVERWTEEAIAAETRAANAIRAQDLLRGLPGATALGAAGLCAVAQKLARHAHGRHAEASDAEELGFAAQP